MGETEGEVPMSKTKTPETSKTFEHPNVEIAVKNFGPIAKATIDLRPLTVFVGPSNTGKTYFSTLIYALHGIFNGFSQLPGRSKQTRNIHVLNLSDQSADEFSEALKKLNTTDRQFQIF